ncbi:16S rRNA (guanine(966)-N(2))-methyltransferase RsmD [Afifella sp. JA880]|uniref:16S rRNA (guanine(966)-N(2))-methyltransferase RsmD n=1 Tax=Afifella sp. JA880 TaxID=2975280 RepID=UPI0021BA9F13|nr:16S rRNA (guanine(966)-N(2))-methyltransferase RsmD [Afifella sp. JA880]MCT8267062.1 16S rRNA (guanine(966)-N(2))-methyltransferase RsmD [Afifella sp. JA880]
MRIVGGSLKGRQLAAPKTQAVRPTTDRLRESLFSILEHRHGLPAKGSRVLDLFAGTGALGLEAISRGAGYALFVEQGVEGRSLIRKNIETLALTGATRIFRRDATRLGVVGTMAPFDLVFCDPPYGKGLGEQALAAALAGGWLKPDALIVLEESDRAEISLPEGFALVDKRESSDTQLIFLQAADAAESVPTSG